jgi:hypothetical protein
MSDANPMGCLVLIAVAVAGALAYYGAFYDTGRQWYEACWAKKAATASFASEPKASDPYMDARWTRCDSTNERAIYEIGFIFAGSPDAATDDDARRLLKACPSSWTMPMAGIYMETLTLIGQQGGISFVDSFTPADWMIQRVWRKNWPNCAFERQRQNYPILVEKQPGSFDWQTPCIPCQKYAPSN